MQGGGDSPVGWGGGIADNGTSLFGAVASLAALYAHKNGGGPQSVGVSLLATLLYRHANVLVAPLADWREAMLGVDPVGPTATHRLYRTADDWLLLAATSEGEWRALDGLDARLPHDFRPGDEAWNARVSAVLEPLLAARETSHWLPELERRGVPAAQPLTLAQVLRAAADAGNRLAEDFTDPKWGGLIGLGELIRFEAPGWRRLGSPPELATLSTARS
jgi:crotonobetainyl-CoA:carnitine CoA-transferase CaiB-like acyl-CoA transferase